MSNLPAVPTKIDTSLRNFLYAVSKLLAPNSQFVKNIQAGVHIPTSTFDTTAIDNLGLTDTSTPPTPQNVIVVGSYSFTIITWDASGYVNYNFAEIWRSTGTQLSSAVLVGTSNGNQFSDSVGFNKSYNYWVRFISNANIAGPYHSSIPVTGATGDLSGADVAVNTIATDRLFTPNAWIGTADILDGGVTNAKIGNFIQSINYNSALHTGWNLDKNGNFSSYGAFSLYDSSGNLVFGSNNPTLDYSRVAGGPPANATNGATSSNLSIGIGGNLVTNSDAASGTAPWGVFWVQAGGVEYSFGQDLPGSSWSPAGGHSVSIRKWGTSATGIIDLSNLSNIPVKPGTRYELSGYIASHRCDADVAVLYSKLVSGVQVQITETHFTPAARLGGGQSLTGWARVGGFITTPTDAQYVNVFLRTHPIDAGQSDCYGFITRTFFAEALPSQTELSPWSPSGNISEHNATNGADYATNVANKPTSLSGINSTEGTKLTGIAAGADVTSASPQSPSWLSSPVVWSGNQISSANISTYIASAAIGNAQIDRASVNKLKVVTADIVDLSVETIKIKDQSITFTVSANGGAILSLASGNNTLSSVTVVIPQNAVLRPVACFCYVRMSANGDVGDGATIYILRDGVSIRNFGNLNTSKSGTFIFVDNAPSVATHVYSLIAVPLSSNNTGAGIDSSNITCLNMVK